MKIKELLEKYQEIEISEDKERQLKEFLGVKENKKWKPNRGELYFMVSYYGMQACAIKWYDRGNDELAYIHDNCFKTLEEAKFRLEQIKVYDELKNFALENNKEKINWNDSCQLKWVIRYDYDIQELSLWDFSYMQYIGQIYFTSRELAKQAIEQIGEERIKKYLFGVE